MPKKKKTKRKTKKSPASHVVGTVEVGTIEPKHVAILNAVDEPVAIVAIPMSSWRKVRDWLGL